MNESSGRCCEEDFGKMVFDDKENHNWRLRIDWIDE